MQEENSLSSDVAPTASEPVSKQARNTAITPRLAAALDCARVSDQNATLILAEAALSFNCSAAEITVNRSTIRLQRKGCRARDELLEFFAAQLAIAQPRGDYRELIELSMIFLGQAPPRGIHFPKAYHKSANKHISGLINTHWLT